jgi:hypothetical protein
MWRRTGWAQALWQLAEAISEKAAVSAGAAANSFIWRC